MLHPLPFESNLKPEPPPHPGEDRNTKKVKTGNDQEITDNMETEHSQELTSQNTHVSATVQSEIVPETLMNIDNQVTETKTPSFKDKLLNEVRVNVGEEDEEIALQQRDVIFGMNGNIPTVNFADHVVETLNKKMGFAVIVKLLGRKIGYRHLRTQLHYLWKPSDKIQITDLDDDCFLVKFKNDMDFQHTLIDGP